MYMCVCSLRGLSPSGSGPYSGDLEGRGNVDGSRCCPAFKRLLSRSEEVLNQRRYTSSGVKFENGLERIIVLLVPTTFIW